MHTSNIFLKENLPRSIIAWSYSLYVFYFDISCQTTLQIGLTNMTYTKTFPFPHIFTSANILRIFSFYQSNCTSLWFLCPRSPTKWSTLYMFVGCSGFLFHKGLLVHLHTLCHRRRHHHHHHYFTILGWLFCIDLWEFFMSSRH